MATTIVWHLYCRGVMRFSPPQRLCLFFLILHTRSSRTSRMGNGIRPCHAETGSPVDDRRFFESSASLICCVAPEWSNIHDAIINKTHRVETCIEDNVRENFHWVLGLNLKLQCIKVIRANCSIVTSFFDLSNFEDIFSL